MPLLIQWVNSGTKIWSTKWGAYNGIAAPGFQHDVVNHLYKFVSPNTGVTTNDVEVMWQRARRKFKSMFITTNCDMISDYLAEFMWNQRFKEYSYFILELKLPNSTLHELHGKNMAFFKSTDLSRKTAFLKATNDQFQIVDV